MAKTLHKLNNIKIEQVFIAYFAFLAKKLDFIVSYSSGITVINCGLNSCIFNIVYGWFSSSVSYWKFEIAQCITGFKDQPFAWVIPPSMRKPELSAFLNHLMLIIDKIEMPMMTCNLLHVPPYSPKTELVIKQVQDSKTLQDFINLIESLDHIIKVFYQQVPLEFLQQSEKLFVGYINHKPVVTGILFEYDDEISGIFKIFTCEEERCKGFGKDMTTYLLKFAENRGNKFVTLMASDLGYPIYKDLGFKESELGKFEYFECRTNC